MPLTSHRSLLFMLGMAHFSIRFKLEMQCFQKRHVTHEEVFVQRKIVPNYSAMHSFLVCTKRHPPIYLK